MPKADKDSVFNPYIPPAEQPIDGADSRTLACLAANNGQDATYVADFDEAVDWIKRTVDKNDILLILGAGDVAEIAERL